MSSLRGTITTHETRRTDNATKGIHIGIGTEETYKACEMPANDELG